MAAAVVAAVATVTVEEAAVVVASTRDVGKTCANTWRLLNHNCTRMYIIFDVTAAVAFFLV